MKIPALLSCYYFILNAFDGNIDRLQITKGDSFSEILQLSFSRLLHLFHDLVEANELRKAVA